MGNKCGRTRSQLLMHHYYLKLNMMRKKREIFINSLTVNGLGYKI